ncbi:MAG: CoA ester lyase [Rhodobacteraceae bacterium]|nr:CoA ester lyase [Paracoccaceae bacterium]
MNSRLRRSALYMPGLNKRAMDKGRTLDADMLLIDLEDSVAPNRKQEARDSSAAAIGKGGYGRREVVLRVNAQDTPYWQDDLDVLTKCTPDGVLVPKINSPEDVLSASTAIRDRVGRRETDLWLMMETPSSVLNSREIAAVVGRVPALQGFVVGTNDLGKDSGVLPGHERLHLLPWLMQLVASAKAFGLDIIDGVFNDFSDEKGFEREARRGRELGMTGKSLIHPRQIAACNKAFSPSKEEIQEARKIVEAFSAKGSADKGVIVVDGRMVERLHLELAESTLARAGVEW